MESSSPPSKLEVAIELLDCGIELHDRGKYFGSLHLAGAAEELFGEYLRRLGRTSSLSAWCTEGVKLANLIAEEDAWTRETMENRLKYAKNRTKHMNASGDTEILFDPEAEAKEILERAVSNFYQLIDLLPLVETPLIQQFNSRRLRA